MSEPDQPDRYGPEPSRKTCRDCGGFVGDRAGCSTNGCPGQEEPADHQGWGDDVTQYMQEAGAMKQLTDAEIDTIAREHFCRNMGDKEGDWGPNSLNQHWCEAIGRPFARAVAAALAAALPPAAVQAWQLIDPQGRVVATERTCIKAWARIYGYEPTVENLLGYEQNGWRVIPLAANEGTLTAGKQGGDGVKEDQRG